MKQRKNYKWSSYNCLENLAVFNEENMNKKLRKYQFLTLNNVVRIMTLFLSIIGCFYRL